MNLDGELPAESAKRLFQLVQTRRVSEVEQAVHLGHMPARRRASSAFPTPRACMLRYSRIFASVNAGSSIKGRPVTAEGHGISSRSEMIPMNMVSSASTARARASSRFAPKVCTPGTSGKETRTRLPSRSSFTEYRNIAGSLLQSQLFLDILDRTLRKLLSGAVHREYGFAGAEANQQMTAFPRLELAALLL